MYRYPSSLIIPSLTLLQTSLLSRTHHYHSHSKRSAIPTFSLISPWHILLAITQKQLLCKLLYQSLYHQRNRTSTKFILRCTIRNWFAQLLRLTQQVLKLYVRKDQLKVLGTSWSCCLQAEFFLFWEASVLISRPFNCFNQSTQIIYDNLSYPQ